MVTTRSTNIHLRKLIADLSKQKVPIWKAVAKELARPIRNRRQVNLMRINKNTKDKDLVVVPGKVLGNGVLDHKVTVAAWRFSDVAYEKVKKAGSEAISIMDLVKKSPQGKGVKIIG